jgi:hypothetical protein
VLGFAAEAFGWGWLLMSSQFVLAVILIYLGFAILAANLWMQAQISVTWRAVGSLFLAACGLAFTFGFVKVDAPLEPFAIVTDAEYESGTIISGITWRSEFTEVNLRLANPTDRDYDELNVLARPTDPVAAIKEVTDLHARFIDNKDFTNHLFEVDPTGSAKELGFVLLATDAGYRIRCPKIPRHDTLQVVMALADIKWNPQKTPPNMNAVDRARNDPEYVLKYKFDDFSSYWFGHKEGAAYAMRLRPSPNSWIKVDGQYTASYRIRKISRKVEIGGLIPKVK